MKYTNISFYGCVACVCAAFVLLAVYVLPFLMLWFSLSDIQRRTAEDIDDDNYIMTNKMQLLSTDENS